MKKFFFALFMLAITAMISFASNAPGVDYQDSYQIEVSDMLQPDFSFDIAPAILTTNYVYLVNEAEVEISFGLITMASNNTIESKNLNYKYSSQAINAKTNVKNELITTNTTADQLTRLSIGLTSNSTVLLSKASEGNISKLIKEPITRLSIGDIASQV